MNFLDLDNYLASRKQEEQYHDMDITTYGNDDYLDNNNRIRKEKERHGGKLLLVSDVGGK